MSAMSEILADKLLEAMHADEAAQILLGTMKNMGPGDSGRIVGMWGSEDRFI